MLMAVCL